MKLVLFDVDGTILLSGGAGMRALNGAFEVRYGVRGAFDGIDPAGKTDPVIFREMFLRAGLPVDRLPAELPALTEIYLDLLARAMPDSPSRLMPGVRELIERLGRAPGILLGLLTGNFERGARIKLEKHDLSRFFPVGAFGSDSEDRNSLVPIALERASRYTGRPIAGERNVVIVGDTVRDVECGKAHGCVIVGVATGGTSAQALADAGADRVFPDFSAPGEALDYILNVT